MIQFTVYTMTERKGTEQRAYVYRECGFPKSYKSSPQFVAERTVTAKNIAEAAQKAFAFAPQVYRVDKLSKAFYSGETFKGAL